MLEAKDKHPFIENKVASQTSLPLTKFRWPEDPFIPSKSDTRSHLRQLFDIVCLATTFNCAAGKK